jgi:dihydrolipoamide dehydrogenase
MARSYDVIVIGAGPAGYVAAIRCAQLGLRTACVDKWLTPDGTPAPGGTCLNVGCIPSKALLQSSELYLQATEHFAEHGVIAQGVSVDVAQMQARKDHVVRQLTDGVAALFNANRIAWLQGQGRLLGSGIVEFTPHGKPEHKETLETSHVILASGSHPIELEAAPLDGERVVDSSGALAFTEVPRRLAIIGAGVIGLELGSVWRRLGSQVVLLEAQDQFLPMVDQQVSHEALKEFTRQGLETRLGARVVSTRRTKKQVTVQYRQDEEEHELKVDYLVVAVGRRPCTDGLFAPESGLLLDERGFVYVDEYCATNLPGVYAVGDVVRGPMLAHKGSEEGIAVAECIANGTRVAVNPDTIPSVIYTQPEIAWVGASEGTLHGHGVTVRAGTFPFAASGRARAMGMTTGLVKILADAESDRILGVHIIGPMASELIAEAVLAMEFSASSEDLARTIHAHPTLTEAMHEAALAVDGRAIHVAGKAGTRKRS